MRQKASFSARGLRRHVIHPKKATRDGDLQDGTVVASPLMSATPSKSTSGSSVTRNDASLHAQSSPIPASMKSGSPEQGSPAQGDLSTTVEPKPPFRPEQLWDQAYDDLKAEEPKLLTQYEMTLSRELEDSSKEATVNVIETNPAKRRSQMDGLLKKGLDKTEKPAQIEQKIGNAIGIVLSVKEAIALGLQAVPIAALAWTGVCFALQTVSNSVDESTANRDGILHVISKMKWYSSLSMLLLDDTSEQAKRSPDLRDHLANQTLGLYKKLLKYVIMSICAYYRNPGLQHLRNLVKFDGWSNSLKDITDAELDVGQAANAYKVNEANTYLKLIFNMHLSTAQSEIMQKLYVANMEAEIVSLVTRKDDLLRDSYKWILYDNDYQDFTDWQHGNKTRLLWIKGDPGKGKTMLLIGIIQELTDQLETHFDKTHLSYFFCQATDARLNTATAVLRGLIWMLLRQERSLIRHLDDFKDVGSKMFEDRTSFYELKKILQNMLEDRALRRAYLVVDALDECGNEEPGLKELLGLISEASRKHDKVKWLVSSRNLLDHGTILETTDRISILPLESSRDSVANAVEAYINHKMSGLAKNYEMSYAGRRDPSIQEKLRQVRDDVAKEIRQKADNTFLWVALVFKQIEGCGPDKVLDRVRKMPSGLTEIYAQMMRQIIKLDDGYSEDCKRVLLTAVNTYRPLHLSELVTLAELSELADHHDIVKHCGLLTINKDDNVVYFVHQSAKDYLIKHAKPEILCEIFPGGLAEGHRLIVSRSLEAMSTTLRRDIYDLEDPGRSIDKVEPVDPDPLTSIRYACVYWIDHLCEADSGPHDKVSLCDGGTIDVFLKEHFLHWLEALSLIRSMSSAVTAIRKLETLLAANPTNAEDILSITRDANRYILYNRSTIEEAPLQVYASALVFSPMKSRIRDLFQKQMPSWIKTKPRVNENWSSCLQTLEGHSALVHSVAFSYDGRRLVSASEDKTVRLWDAVTGARLQTFIGHTDRVISVAFSCDGQQLASASLDKTVRLWHTETGAELQILSLTDQVYSVAFSSDGQLLASASNDDMTVRLWDAVTGAGLQTFIGHTDRVISVIFSCDGQQLASVSRDETIRLWDTETGAELQTFINHAGCIRSVALSSDGRLVSASDDMTVRLWDTETGAELQTFNHTYGVTSVTFSHDDRQLASTSEDGTVRLWDIETGAVLQTFNGRTDEVTSVAFSHDNGQLVSASDDKTVRLWDTETGAELQCFAIGAALQDLSFSSDSSHILTEMGSFALSQSRVGEIPAWSSYCVQSDFSWITWEGKKVLWLPPEYRPRCLSIKDQVIAIGCHSGQVLLLQFESGIWPIASS